MESSGQFWDTDEIIVYSDDRYILGIKKAASLTVCGRTYVLSCQPYEPCLYITDEKGVMTVVHNAFDPFAVFELFCDGKTVESVSGKEYGAKDFCVMVEYASGKGEISVSDAERVFAGREKKKKNEGKSEERPFGADSGSIQKTGSVIENDPFYDIYGEYPDSVIDYCLVKNNTDYSRYASHKGALATACAELFYDGGQLEWRYELERAEAKKTDTDRLFGRSEDGLTYRGAFLYPPYPNGYKPADFERINNALFPYGRDGLEIYEWTTDWSEYFDDGHEWWGTLCLTVYDKRLDRFAVIMASATD